MTDCVIFLRIAGTFYILITADSIIGYSRSNKNSDGVNWLNIYYKSIRTNCSEKIR